MGFSRQEYRSGLPFPSPGNLPDPGIEPRSPTLQTDTLLSAPPGKSWMNGEEVPNYLPSLLQIFLAATKQALLAFIMAHLCSMKIIWPDILFLQLHLLFPSFLKSEMAALSDPLYFTVNYTSNISYTLTSLIFFYSFPLLSNSYNEKTHFILLFCHSSKTFINVLKTTMCQTLL